MSVEMVFGIRHSLCSWPNFLEHHPISSQFLVGLDCGS